MTLDIATFPSKKDNPNPNNIDEAIKYVFMNGSITVKRKRKIVIN
jgi:hypothetical protein